ncbi:MAG: 50S ribosomal protein L11 [Hadesarchaea archaeon]|jgi:large subunit ribosomal protein L11|nr:50S ribosomal protein L11 [Hadesarchaea archaeon]
MKARIKLLVEGGKANPGPPLGPALGPLGVNVAQVVQKINQETAKFSGMKVPVILTVDRKTKEFQIEVGSPPVSVLVKKELGLEKGAKTPGKETVGNLSLSQVIQIAKQKGGRDLRAKVKEVLGTCKSMGVTVEGKDPVEVQREIEEGRYEEELK